MTRLLRLAAAAAAVAIAIAACSSGNDSSGSAAPSVATTTSAAAPTTSAPAGGEATSSSSDDNGGGKAAESGTITIQDFAFGTPLTVRPGAMIKVTNQDGAAHDVASDDSGKFRTPLLNQGESATFTAPTEPGTYKFSCTVHAQMTGTGTLVVHG
jgi:plastocyanin